MGGGTRPDISRDCFNTMNQIWQPDDLVKHLGHEFVSIVLLLSHLTHDDVIKWKHFPRNWPLVRGIHRSPVNSPHKGQWRGALMFSSIYAWINGWVNNGETGDLKRHGTHYDVTVMSFSMFSITRSVRMKCRFHEMLVVIVIAITEIPTIVTYRVDCSAHWISYVHLY